MTEGPAGASALDPAPAPSEPSPAAAEARTSELADAALQRWIADGRAELLPRDRLCLILRCGVCGEQRPVGFGLGRSPYFGEPPMPLYRDLEQLYGLLEDVHRRRLADVDPEEWEAPRRCPCGAPPQACTTVLALLFRSMRGTGACLLAGVDGAGRRSAWRCPVDGIPQSIGVDAASVFAAFGRPLSLLGLLSQLAGGEGPSVRGLRAEPGVTLWWSGPGEPLERAVAESAGGRPLCVVEVGDDLVEGPSWPRSLKDAWLDRERGTRAALAVDRDRLRRLLATLAARYLTSELRDGGADMFVLRQDGLAIPVSATSIVRQMIAHGRTLAEASAHALEAADAQREAALDLVRALSQHRPELLWRVEDGLLTCVHPDGRSGRSVDVVRLAQAVEPGSPDAGREAAYLADDLPSWADPTRLCPCGAQATVLARVVERAALESFEREHSGARPGIVEAWGEPETTAAAVVALGCERHVRVPTEAELIRLGLDAETIRRRLDADAPEVRLTLVTKTLQSEGGSRAVLVRGPLAASVIRVEGWARAILRELGDPLRGERVESWAFFEGGLVLVEERWATDRRPLLARSLAIFCGRDPAAGPSFAIQTPLSREGPAFGRILIRSA